MFNFEQKKMDRIAQLSQKIQAKEPAFTDAHKQATITKAERLCRALGDNVEHPCSTKALAKRDMLIAGLGHLPRLKFAALSKVSA